MKIIIIGAGQGLGKVLSKMLRVRGHEVVSGFRNMNSERGGDLRPADGCDRSGTDEGGCRYSKRADG